LVNFISFSSYAKTIAMAFIMTFNLLNVDYLKMEFEALASKAS
jgi:hypothetical protein